MNIDDQSPQTFCPQKTTRRPDPKFHPSRNRLVPLNINIIIIISVLHHASAILSRATYLSPHVECRVQSTIPGSGCDPNLAISLQICHTEQVSHNPGWYCASGSSRILVSGHLQIKLQFGSSSSTGRTKRGPFHHRFAALGMCVILGGRV